MNFVDQCIEIAVQLLRSGDFCCNLNEAKSKTTKCMSQVLNEKAF